VWNQSLDGGQFSGALLAALGKRERWPASLKLVIWGSRKRPVAAIDRRRARRAGAATACRPTMLFNSYLFLLLFLPLTLAAHYLIAARSLRGAALWLCVTSIVFYGWWNPQFVLLLIGSIAFNYLVSLAILGTRACNC
jgi:hypothetical protein